jgi:pyridoxamine 5'-phosphate oxidase
MKHPRKEYVLSKLNRENLSENPFTQLINWLDDAEKEGVSEPLALCLSTVDKESKPSSRIVLLRDISEKGLVFFTNYLSKKAEDLNCNSYACMNFFWPELERQIRVEGKVEKVNEMLSDSYFKSRPLESQVAAWVSPQSRIIGSREELILSFEEKLKSTSHQELDRPPYWGGFILIPTYFEFWQGREFRIHDRFKFDLQTNFIWKVERLAP